ncbi:MAG: PRC-barrel domain-containing protein [Candidatus Heimdallarchaeota archaeon]|nr:PRC-barrel domain-containing protein [Candidatus Heimdallarchaeota archaeon]
MDMCKLETYENVSDIRKKIVLSSNKTKLGYVNDIVFDDQYNIKSFILAGHPWEELKKTIDIFDDIELIIFTEDIQNINKNEILLNLSTKEIIKKMLENEISPIDITYNTLRRRAVLDYNGHPIGKVCNLIFLPCGEAAFVVSCAKNNNKMIPQGLGKDWDLLVPTNIIESISSNEITIAVKGSSLEKTLKQHLLDPEAATAYLNSIQKRNTVEMKAFIRVAPFNYLR